MHRLTNQLANVEAQRFEPFSRPLQTSLGRRRVRVDAAEVSVIHLVLACRLRVRHFILISATN